MLITRMPSPHLAVRLGTDLPSFVNVDAIDPRASCETGVPQPGANGFITECGESHGGKMEVGTFAEKYLEETAAVIAQLDRNMIEKVVGVLAETRASGGRMFILGVGGSAANASHAVNDFRKIVGIEAYAPTDNVAELTARTNDEGWAGVFDAWLRTSHLNTRDLILVFSVGGGNLEKNVSPNLVAALQLAKSVGCRIIGVVGRDGGYTARVADACVIVPTVNPEHVTPHSEALQAVVWHLLVSHPALKQCETKWESVK